MKFDKLYALNGFEDGELNLTNKNPGINEDVAVIYSVCWEERYLEFLKYSLYTNYMATDLNLDHTYVISDITLFDKTKKAVSGLIAEKNVLCVPDYMTAKISAAVLPELDKYEIKIIVDTDMFFYSRKSLDFYTKISNYLDINENSVLTFETNKNASGTVKMRGNNLRGLYKTSDDFYKYFEDFSTISFDNSIWYLSCIYAFKTKNFCSPEFKTHTLNALLKFVACDETVWNTWAWRNKYKLEKISEIPGIKLFLYNNDPNIFDDDDIHLVHNIVGQGCQQLETYYLLNKMREKYEQIL